jgi:glycine cleavage system H protein
LDFNDNTTVSSGDTFGTVEAVKTVADLYAPVSGTIIECNTALNDGPEQVNQDPYGAGWLMKIELSNPTELDGLMDADAYRALVGA